MNRYINYEDFLKEVSSLNLCDYAKRWYEMSIGEHKWRTKLKTS